MPGCERRTTPSEPLVGAVTVTYGERSALCRRVVEGALAAGVEHVVVVDNGSLPAARVDLGAVASEHGGRVTLRRMADNGGSAAGFAAGITTALESTSADLIWLLDDDNVPEGGSLTELLRWHAHLTAERNDHVALLAYRPARKYQRLMVSGWETGDAYPPPSSFLSFDTTQYVRGLVRRGKGAAARHAPGAGERASRTSPIAVPYGPFGGLLIPRDLVGEVGLPNASFVLYEDDADFTARIVRAGVPLYLVPSSRIDEIDESWYTAVPGAIPSAGCSTRPRRRSCTTARATACTSNAGTAPDGARRAPRTARCS